MSNAQVISGSDSRLLELARCDNDATYFVQNYVWIYNATETEWIPFKMWPEQERMLRVMQSEQEIIILKARQLGLTWLCLAHILHKVLFRGAPTALLFSRRDKEATHLLEFRLKGMFKRLPDWMQLGTVKDDMHDWRLSNGAAVQAFPANAGDSYTGTVALIDEADLIPKLDRLLASVKPTIADGGQLILLSRVDKEKPNSTFKRIYRAAKEGRNDYCPVFLPWSARPDRSAEWYAARVADSMSDTGAMDAVHEQYPATEEEALKPPTLNKRIPAAWLTACYTSTGTVAPPKPVSDITGLTVYRVPKGRVVCGADPAEGNPNSDDSAATWMDAGTGEEVATLAGKYEPGVFASLISRVSSALGNTDVMVERNNHGHAVLLWLRDNPAAGVRVLAGRDGRPGWVSSSLGKTMMYDAAVDQVKNGELQIHSLDTYLQLSSIESSTLRAPDGEQDDRADSVALIAAARNKPSHWLLGE